MLLTDERIECQVSDAMMMNLCSNVILFLVIGHIQKDKTKLRKTCVAFFIYFVAP